MSEQLAVIYGLGIIFVGLAWIAFEFNHSDKDLFKYISTIFLALAIATLQIIGWVGLQIADAAGMTYITTGVTVPIMWILSIALFLFWAVLLIYSLVYLVAAIYKVVTKLFGGQADDGKE